MPSTRCERSEETDVFGRARGETKIWWLAGGGAGGVLAGEASVETCRQAVRASGSLETRGTVREGGACMRCGRVGMAAGAE